MYPSLHQFHFVCFQILFQYLVQPILLDICMGVSNYAAPPCTHLPTWHTCMFCLWLLGHVNTISHSQRNSDTSIRCQLFTGWISKIPYTQAKNKRGYPPWLFFFFTWLVAGFSVFVCLWFGVFLVFGLVVGWVCVFFGWLFFWHLFFFFSFLAITLSDNQVSFPNLVPVTAPIPKKHTEI